MRKGRAVASARCLLAGAAAIAFPAGAQDTLEEVVITGSRLARPDFESASPIVTVAGERFEQTGSATIDSTINSLPQFVPAVTSASNNPANGGQANVSLRGLGQTSTLVLLDGRRLMPANGNGVVDLNIVPSSLIESVEIVTGGASAVYGSDAMAGVVNFKLRESFDGVEIDGLWGETDRSDGAQYAGTLSAGTDFARGRGSVVGLVNYSERELVSRADREFSRYALGYYGPGSGTPGLPEGFRFEGSAAIEEGHAFEIFASPEVFDNLFVSYGFAPGEVPYQSGFGVNADGTLFTTGHFRPGGPASGGVKNLRGERDPLLENDALYTYNFAPSSAMQLPLARTSAFARARFEATESAEVYVQGLYSDYDVSLRLAPTPTDPFYVPPTNPHVPADLKRLLDARADDPDAPFPVVKRLGELGPRLADLSYEVYQLTAGVEGSLFDRWRFEVYVQRGGNRQTDRQTNNASLSRIEQLTFAPDGGATICGGFDPFGPGSISAGCADYIKVDSATNRAQVDQVLAEASISGRLLAMPAGGLNVVAGFFLKRDEYQYTADPSASLFLADGRPDMLGFSASDDIQGDDSNLDVYVEALVPLLASRPGAQRLEVVAGYRHSQYESIGGVESYKGDLLYQPVEPVTLRGSYQHAVRAPSIYELYLPRLSTRYSITSEDAHDPCAYDSPERKGADAAAVEALCLAQGVPADLLPEFSDRDGTIHGYAGGNPDLDAERASSLTFGVVLESAATHSLLADIQVSIDWYEIEIEDRISEVHAGIAIPLCYDRDANPGLSPDNRWCRTFGRDPLTGEIEDALTVYQNTEGVRTSGVDLQIDWTFDAGPGRVGVNWLVSYLSSYEQSETAGVPAQPLEGTVGSRYFESSLPEWKWNLNLGYSIGPLALNARWKHVEGMTDFYEPSFHIPPVDYFDLDARYAFDSGWFNGLTVRFGVENVGDRDPPAFPSQNNDPVQYDMMGRRYYVGVRHAF